MRKIVYHVATSIDHFIANPDGGIRGFLPDGEHAVEYLETLQHYDTVIMGRKTYEFGYDFGLKPGDNPYPHMRCYIFSTSLQFEKLQPGVELVQNNALDTIRQLKSEEGTAIYLCGGGNFSGQLLEAGLIDELVLKVNPFLMGAGIPLFGSTKKEAQLDLFASKVYDNGVLLLSYRIRN